MSYLSLIYYTKIVLQLIFTFVYSRTLNQDEFGHGDFPADVNDVLMEYFAYESEDCPNEPEQELVLDEGEEASRNIFDDELINLPADEQEGRVQDGVELTEEEKSFLTRIVVWTAATLCSRASTS